MHSTWLRYTEVRDIDMFLPFSRLAGQAPESVNLFFRKPQEGNFRMDVANKIMVAVGFTEYSEELLEYAAAIANGIQAELIVVNIITGGMWKPWDRLLPWDTRSTAKITCRG